MKKFIYPFFVFLSAVFWGISGVFVRKLGELGFSTYEIVFVRMLLSALIIALAFLVVDKNIFKIKLKDLWIFVCSGALSVFGTSLCYFATMEQASLSTACILMNTAPIFVIVISAFLFKEKITLIKICGLVLTIVGCIFCCYEKGAFNLSLPALLVGVSAGVFYASYSIFSRVAINKGYGSKTILLYSLIFAFVGSTFFVPYGDFIANISANFNFVIPAILLAVISTVLPYWFFTLGLNGTENGKASIIASFEIAVSLLTGLIAYSEFPSPIKYIGMVLVFMAIVILNVNFKKRNKRGKKTLLNE